MSQKAAFYDKNAAKNTSNKLKISQHMKFKTTINCNSCINLVRNYIDEVPHVQHWEVDTANPNKILTVAGQNVDQQQVITKVKEAGFQIEAI